MPPDRTPSIRNPLATMQIRDHSAHNTYGPVRNNGNRVHQGWDLAAPVGTPIYAVADSTVESVHLGGGDYGNSVQIAFAYQGRTIYAFYGHLSYFSVQVGDRVQAGQIIGYTGRSGNARGAGITPHLHFEFRDRPVVHRGLGGRIDPATILGPAPGLRRNQRVIPHHHPHHDRPAAPTQDHAPPPTPSSPNNSRGTQNIT